MLRLLMWEALHYRDEDLVHPDWRIERCRGKADSLAAGLGREPSAEIGRTMLTLIRLAAWPTAMPHMARLVVGDAVDVPDGRSRMRAHVMAFARAALGGAALEGVPDPVATP